MITISWLNQLYQHQLFFPEDRLWISCNRSLAAVEQKITLACTEQSFSSSIQTIWLSIWVSSPSTVVLNYSDKLCCTYWKHFNRDELSSRRPIQSVWKERLLYIQYTLVNIMLQGNLITRLLLVYLFIYFCVFSGHLIPSIYNLKPSL